MNEVLVLLPLAELQALGAPPAGAVLAPYANVVDAVVALRASSAPAVLWSDGVGEDGYEAVAAALRDRRGPCIEVRSQPWDGQAHSAISAACRGVISGFGAAGVGAALSVLSG